MCEQKAQVVGVIQARHDDDRLAIDNAMLRNIGSRQVTGPENAFIDVVTQAIFIDSMTGTDPTHRALTGHGGEGVESSPDEFLLGLGIQ